MLFRLIINIDESQNPHKWVFDDAVFDLMFLCYTVDAAFQKELASITNKNKNVQWRDVSMSNAGKWKNIKRFYRFSAHQYHWFPDPDTEMPPHEINNFLRFAKNQNLALCQPGLTPDSRCSHQFLKSHPGGVLRPTKFVEVMCPLFRRDILHELLWTFELSKSGYGIDLLWASLMAKAEKPMHVVDKFQIHHGRAPQFHLEAGKRGWEMPGDEFQKLKKRFGLGEVEDLME